MKLGAAMFFCLRLFGALVLVQGGNKVTPRIVGGSPAGNDEYPYFIRWGGCGATLIHPDIALGAAHVESLVWQLDATEMLNAMSIMFGSSGGDVAHVGSTKRDAVDDDSIATTVVQTVEHPDFEQATFSYDFVVLKLNGWMEKETVRLSSSSPSAGDTLTVIGFGLTEEGGTNSDTLLEGQVNYVDPTICAEILATENEVIDNVMFCAEGQGVDACVGDSGGPILDGNGRQVGIVSWGIGCARPGVPAVYSRISGAADWIENQICRLSEDPPNSCSGGQIRQNFLRLDIYYDSNPTDTSWSIATISGDIVQTSSRVNEEQILVSTFIDINDGVYVFEIKDEFGDGFDGEGRYELYFEGDELLLSGGGDIGYGTSIQFRVGDPSPTQTPSASGTPFPTLAPTNDSTKSPTPRPTKSPSRRPSPTPAPTATNLPTAKPTARTTATEQPQSSTPVSISPALQPSKPPSLDQSSAPSTGPRSPIPTPSSLPTSNISTIPTITASSQPPSSSTTFPLPSSSQPSSGVPVSNTYFASIYPSKDSNEPSLPTGSPTISFSPSQSFPPSSSPSRTPADTQLDSRSPVPTLDGMDQQPLESVLIRVEVSIQATPEDVSLWIKGPSGKLEAEFSRGFYKKTGTINHYVILNSGDSKIKFANQSGEGQVAVTIYRLVGTSFVQVGSGNLDGQPPMSSSSFVVSI